MAFLTEDYSDTNYAPDWRCALLGCKTESYPACVRCHSDLYGDVDFVEYGLVDRLYGFWWRLSCRFRPVKCSNCARWVYWPCVSMEPPIVFCDKRCEDEWMPF